MKKKICVIAIAALMALSLSACGKELESIDNPGKSMFVRVEATEAFSIVYHKETKVMYAVSTGTYNFGTFTLLVNADGSPMRYTG